MQLGHRRRCPGPRSRSSLHLANLQRRLRKHHGLFQALLPPRIRPFDIDVKQQAVVQLDGHYRRCHPGRLGHRHGDEFRHPKTAFLGRRHTERRGIQIPCGQRLDDKLRRGGRTPFAERRQHQGHGGQLPRIRHPEQLCGDHLRTQCRRLRRGRRRRTRPGAGNGRLVHPRPDRRNPRLGPDGHGERQLEHRGLQGRRNRGSRQLGIPLQERRRVAVDRGRRRIRRQQPLHLHDRLGLQGFGRQGQCRDRRSRHLRLLAAARGRTRLRDGRRRQARAGRRHMGTGRQHHRMG